MNLCAHCPTPSKPCWYKLGDGPCWEAETEYPQVLISDCFRDVLAVLQGHSCWIGGASLEEEGMAGVTDSDWFGRCRQGKLIVGAAVAENLSTVPAVVLWTHGNSRSCFYIFLGPIHWHIFSPVSGPITHLRPAWHLFNAVAFRCCWALKPTISHLSPVTDLFIFPGRGSVLNRCSMST